MRWWPPAPRVVETTEVWCAVRPNPSLNRTRYGKRRKPSLRYLVHHLSPGLRRLPSRSG